MTDAENERRGEERFSDALTARRVRRLLALRLHWLLPLLDPADARGPETLVRTLADRDEIDLDTALRSGRVAALQLLRALEALCVALALCEAFRSPHGNVHESSLYFSPGSATRQFVLRGFAAGPGEAAGSDRRLLAEMLGRLSAARALPLDAAVDALDTGGFAAAAGAISACCRSPAPARALTTYAQDWLLRRVEVRAVPLPVGAERLAEMHNTLTLVAAGMALGRDAPRVPLFYPEGSPARGTAPHALLVSQYVGELVVRGVLQRDADGYLWPAKIEQVPADQRWLCTRRTYYALGLLTAEALLLGGGVACRFSPLLVRVLLLTGADAGGIAGGLYARRDVAGPVSGLLADMNLGAGNLARALAADGLQFESLMECGVWGAAAAVARGVVLADAPDAVRIEGGSDAQRVVLLQWLRGLVAADFVQFLAWVGGDAATAWQHGVTIEVRDDGGGDVRVQACERRMVVPSTAVASPAHCAVVMTAVLAGDSALFNCK